MWRARFCVLFAHHIHSFLRTHYSHLLNSLSWRPRAEYGIGLGVFLAFSGAFKSGALTSLFIYPVGWSAVFRCVVAFHRRHRKGRGSLSIDTFGFVFASASCLPVGFFSLSPMQCNHPITLRYF
ncbi:hypothetical protein BU26DRAFT_60678 [Trematosphaeria pertusa]|uniref:Uncharacterized protein n=1 Tax=Trematosphaeria pertusa TaxID=390896 RepID=A0A6A6I7V3_9PLEO|nr:uncharacterized protein BU26DRAFT_60678 [Trematosphaeria pertusa]KAF2246042.1 hypothetical protein BU26DRAFT_60678 [Trematosphaeria pertusa]